jgi:hypothetical protein
MKPEPPVTNALFCSVATEGTYRAEFLGALEKLRRVKPLFFAGT